MTAPPNCDGRFKSANRSAGVLVHSIPNRALFGKGRSPAVTG